MPLFLAKHISLFTLFFLVMQVSARESVFFSKFSRPTETPLDNQTEANHQAALQKEQQQLPQQSRHNAYGLYGRQGPEQSSFSPPTVVATTNGFFSSFPNISQQNNDEYEIEWRKKNIDDYPSKKYEYETEWRKNNVDDDTNKKLYYGMSDTKFLEKDKYYYDVNGERDRNVFGLQRKSGTKSYNSRMDEYQEYQEETKEDDQYINP